MSGAGAGTSGEFASDTPGSWAGWESSWARGCAGGSRRGPRGARGVPWRRLAARSLLPPEPQPQRGENRAESWVSPRKSDRQGLFYGEGEGAGSDASISGRAGTQSPCGESPSGAEDSSGERVESGTLGRDRPALGRGRPRGRIWSSPPARPVLSSPGAPSAIPGSAHSPGPASQARGGGETFSLETLDTNFVFWGKKNKPCLERGGGGGAVSKGRGEPAAEQTLRIRFQRLRPTPSPAAVICVRGSVTLRGIKRPAGTGRVQRDSGQRGGLRQRRWFISALPARARSVCPPARAPGQGESWGLQGRPRPE